jgi:tetratricopeptide (TPR) repeat protein
MRGLKLGAWLLAGLTLLLLSRPELSLAQATGAAQYYAAGNQLYTARNYAQAAQYYSAATKMDPNYSPAYQGLGNCFYALGRRSDALAFYQRALALNPSNAQLSQFVQSLQNQLGAAGQPALVATPTAMQQGITLMKQRQYADALPFFQQAISDTPNDYRPYYYAGYASAMTRDNKDAALYFALANQKYPNASIQNMAYRYKMALGPDDQQWVSDQMAKSAQGEAVAGAASKFTPNFGFHIEGGVYNILSNPTDIQNGAIAAHSVSLTGQTPAWSPLISFEPYYQFSPNFEVNLEVAYLPAGTLSYSWFNTAMGGTDDYQYSYSISMVNLGLGLRINFGDSDTVPYLEAGAELSPTSLAFTKQALDSTPATNGMTDNFTGMAFGGHADIGVDFKLSKELLLGPYVGFRYLNISSFSDSSGAVLKVDKNSGDVTTPSTAAGAASAQSGANYVPLTLDLSGIKAGLNLTLVF